jgi:hypothetical protein
MGCECKYSAKEPQFGLFPQRLKHGQSRDEAVGRTNQEEDGRRLRMADVHIETRKMAERGSGTIPRRC